MPITTGRLADRYGARVPKKISDPTRATERADADDVGQIDAVHHVLDVVTRVTRMRFAAVARVTGDRWVACGVTGGELFGLGPGGDLPIEATLCASVRALREPIVIDDTQASDRYRDHPATVRLGFRSYISVPIVCADGVVFGTLCAFDREPADIDRPEILGMFELFGKLIASQIDLLARARGSFEDLGREQEIGRLRENFIAVLGHDLRSPLAALRSGLHVLRRRTGGATHVRLFELMQRSVLRMSAMVDDMVDFTRGRIAGGLGLILEDGVRLESLLGHVRDEVRAVHPDRAIEMRCESGLEVRCDPGRISQLVTNLLTNALVHGERDGPVSVRGRGIATGWQIEVCNAGRPIPQDVRGNLFTPFARANPRTSREGIGLGLYIAAEISRAHGGRLEIDDDASMTCVRLLVPRVGAPT